MREPHVLITGGAGNLGLHVTHAFVGAGARVTVPLPDAHQGERLAAALGDHRARVATPTADLTDEADVGALFAIPDPPLWVVHLVGGFAMGALHEAELSTLRQQLDLNVVSTFLVLKHALLAMRAAGHGRIVTVASKAALAPSAGMGIYAAAKAAVLAMTQAVAEETKGTDITANVILPTVIDTPVNRTAMGEAHAADWVRPERLAETIRFLCSDAAGDLRGTAVRAYGSV